MNKKFAVRLYINNDKVYLKDNMAEALGEEIFSKVTFFGDSFADELIISIRANGDEEKENALKLLKSITAVSEIPVTTTFPIKRMEDVKKLIYAGAKNVVLNLSDTSNWDILEEVSQKFGKDKISVTVDDFSSFGIYHKSAENFAHALYLFDSTKAKECIEVTSLPCMVCMPDVFPDKLLDSMNEENVLGIFGNVIDDNVKEINALKNLCVEKGICVESLKPSIPWNELKKNEQGLVPVIAQDYKTSEVLMMAYMNEEAYNQTFLTGKMNYYSRSRQSQWVKGETSGHFQYVKAIYADCDNDTLLAKVSQVGAACHTGNYSCFFKEIAKKPYQEKNPLKVFESVYGVIKDRQENPKEGSYTNYLFDKGIDKILKKVGEECTEIVIAAKNPEAGEIKYEISDFLYHVMVLMVLKEVTWEDITDELASR